MTKETVYDPVASNSDPGTVVGHVLCDTPMRKYYRYHSDTWIGVGYLHNIRRTIWRLKSVRERERERVRERA